MHSRICADDMTRQVTTVDTDSEALGRAGPRYSPSGRAELPLTKSGAGPPPMGRFP